MNDGTRNTLAEAAIWAGGAALLLLAIAGLSASRSQAQIVAPPAAAVMPYAIGEEGDFEERPLPPHALVFVNGLFQAPVLNYTVIPDTGQGARFRFRAGTLTEGDLILVVVAR